MSSSRLPSKINSTKIKTRVRNALADSTPAPFHDQSALAGRMLASTEESRGDPDIKTDAVQDQVVALIALDQDLAAGRDR
jgi:hypothetical protein